MEQSYDSNIERVASGEQSEWTTAVSPHLVFERSTQRNTLTLEYAPRFNYSYLTEETRVDHVSKAQFQANPIRNLLVEIQNSFVQAERPLSDPNFYPTGETIELADRRGKSRYWTYNFVSLANYQYARESTVEVAYRYSMLENKESGSSDYVKHSPEISILHRINQRWNVQWDYMFIKGDFDDSEDLNTHHSNVYVYYGWSPLTRIFGHYGYVQTDNSGSASDYSSQSGAIGIDKQISPTLSFGLESGVSLLQRDNLPDHEVLYLRTTLAKQYLNNSFSLSAESGLEDQQFSGVDDLGLHRYWGVNGRLTRSVTKNITGTFTLSYREDTYIDRQPEEKEEQFSSGILLAYSFSRNYRVNLRYRYIHLAADLEENGYENHSIMLQLSGTKDLFRW